MTDTLKTFFINCKDTESNKQTSSPYSWIEDGKSTPSRLYYVSCVNRLTDRVHLGPFSKLQQYKY